MVYFLGKDVDIYWTTEQLYWGLSGTQSATAGDSLAAWIGGGATGLLVRPRQDGVSSSTQLSDVTGIDFSIGATDEDITYMGKNTHLSAKIKNEFSVTLTKKKNDLVWDRMYNQRGRNGVYTTSGSQSTVYPDYSGGAAASSSGISGTGVVHDGLTTSKMQNLGYRIYLILKDASEVFILRNCCMTAHTVSLNADGTQEETAEFYSYVKPRLVSGTNATSIPLVTGLTSLSEI
tara:strand:+ start:4787 stop:5485 length:699 start_codon:yes stop_codon:yes gene_type:complete